MLKINENNGYINLLTTVMNDLEKNKRFIDDLRLAILEKGESEVVEVYFDDILKEFKIYTEYDSNVLRGLITPIYTVSDIFDISNTNKIFQLHNDKIQEFFKFYYHTLLTLSDLKLDFENKRTYVYKLILNSYSFNALRFLNVPHAELLNRMNNFTDFELVKRSHRYHNDQLINFIQKMRLFFEQTPSTVYLKELQELHLSNNYNYNILIDSEPSFLSNLSDKDSFELLKKLNILLLVFKPTFSCSENIQNYYQQTTFEKYSHKKSLLKKIITLNNKNRTK